MFAPSVAIAGFVILSELVRALGSEIVGEHLAKGMGELWKRYTISNHDLERGLREAYRQALTAIAIGLKWHTSNPLQHALRRMVNPGVVNVFAATLDKELVSPFVRFRNLSSPEIIHLRDMSGAQCALLRHRADEVLAMSELASATVDDLLWNGQPLGSTEIEARYEKTKVELMDRVCAIPGIAPIFCDFLKHRDLFPSAIAYFFREQLKENPRLRAIRAETGLQKVRLEHQKQYETLSGQIETLGEHLERAHANRELADVRRYTEQLKQVQVQLETIQSAIARLSQLQALQVTLETVIEGKGRLIPQTFDAMRREGQLTQLDQWVRDDSDERAQLLDRVESRLNSSPVLVPGERRTLTHTIYYDPNLHAKYDFDEQKDFIAAGATGRVYRVLHQATRQCRALKILKQELRHDPEIASRFLQEGQILHRIRDEAIVRIHEIGGGGPDAIFYLDLEWVEGKNLRQWIDELPFSARPWETVHDLCSQLARALALLHDAGIWHRDVNPSNIMVQPSGRIKLMDFGIAKIAEEQSRTVPGVAFGTRPYWAPEQAAGAPGINHLADIYSFGVVAYELCTGRLPDENGPESILQFNAQVPAWFDALIRVCLIRQREHRLQSMTKIRDVLLDPAQWIGQEMLHPPQEPEVPAVRVPATPPAPGPPLPTPASESVVVAPPPDPSAIPLPRPAGPVGVQIRIETLPPGKTMSEMQVDAIVCVGDWRVPLTNDAQALLRRGGVNPASVHDRVVRLVPGQVWEIGVSGRNLRYILLAVLEPTEKGVHDLAMACLNSAHSLNLSGVAIPLLGSGHHAGLSAESATRSFVGGICDFLSSVEPAPSSLNTIVVVARHGAPNLLRAEFRRVGLDAG